MNFEQHNKEIFGPIGFSYVSTAGMLLLFWKRNAISRLGINDGLGFMFLARSISPDNLTFSNIQSNIFSLTLTLCSDLTFQ